MSFWRVDFHRLLDEAAVPGAAVAIVRAGHPVQYINCGVRGVQVRELIDEHTIFDAASLSKPVFAYAVLQLVDQGMLELDAPISTYLPNYIAGDPRASSITVSDLLSHSAGLPNWRNHDYPLRTYFCRGERFSYSGEGYLYLQNAIEVVTGVKLHILAQRLVFEPLAMKTSSFIWQENFDPIRAYPHDAFGVPALRFKSGEANAAWSLQTCAADYARFLQAVLVGSRLTLESARLWLHPRVEVKHWGIQCLGSSAEDVATHVAWGLGWGLETDTGLFFHWGDNEPFTAFTIGSVRDRTGLVVFTNGASGLSIMPEIVAQFVPGERPSLTWLNYVRHDAPVRRMLRLALDREVESVWADIESAALDREDVLWIANGLNVRGREKESLWLQAKANAKRATQ